MWKKACQTEINANLQRRKSGVFTGGYAINPVNDEKIPVWVADYVLMSYGTGAIMGVPAHDQRDFDFARKFGIEVRVVIQPEGVEPLDGAIMPEAVPADGAMVNSGPLTGTPAGQTIKTAINYIKEKNIGEGAVTYRIRDWLISRQRYWGAPIPIVFCKMRQVAVPEDQLPVELPDNVNETDRKPLKLHPVAITQCHYAATPARNRYDGYFHVLIWYHLRYLSGF